MLDNRTSPTQTLIEVVTRDRPGLLITLSRAFYALSLTIGVAKINTEGSRAIDVFYVTELDGRKGDAPERIEQVRGVPSAPAVALAPHAAALAGARFLNVVGEPVGRGSNRRAAGPPSWAAAPLAGCAISSTCFFSWAVH